MTLGLLYRIFYHCL